MPLFFFGKSKKEPDADPTGSGFSALISKDDGLSGTYKVTVTVKAAGTDEYLPKSVKKTITVKVK